MIAIPIDIFAAVSHFLVYKFKKIEFKIDKKKKPKLISNRGKNEFEKELNTTLSYPFKWCEVKRHKHICLLFAQFNG